MSELLSGVIGAVLGAIIAGALSIIATKVSLAGERKKQKETDMRMFKLQNAHEDRQRKIELYKDLLNIIANIYIAMHIQPDKEGVEWTLVDNAAYCKFAQELEEFYEANMGLIDIYVPSEINRKLFELRRSIYKLSQDQTMLTSSDTAESVREKMEKAGLDKLMPSLINVRGEICKDINKDSTI